MFKIFIIHEGDKKTEITSYRDNSYAGTIERALEIAQRGFTEPVVGNRARTRVVLPKDIEEIYVEYVESETQVAVGQNIAQAGAATVSVG
jgi:hypothetical protein